MGNGVAVRLLRCAIAVALVSLAGLAPAAGAKTIKPKTLSDHAPNGCTKQDCTLREAVDKANSTPAKDAIKLRGGKTYKLHVAGTDEDMNASGDIDILAPLKISAKGKRATVNGKKVDRVFDVPLMGSDAKFVNLVITRGDPTGMNPGASGGGIAAEGSGKVSLIKSVVTHNHAPLSGGGIAVASSVSAFKISRSSIVSNDASSGGGLDSDADTTVVGSTIAKNEASSTGGGAKTHQGLTLRNSTIYGNKSDGDGGGISALANTTLNSVTIVKNKTGGAGGGIDSSGTTTVSNSLIALNTLKPMAVGGPDCGGVFMSAGHNLLSDDAGCTGFTGTGDIVKPNPKLGKLDSNGGPTKTVALLKGSPAIGKAGNDSEPKDQRGHKRDNHPDIGAFER